MVLSVVGHIGRRKLTCLELACYNYRTQSLRISRKMRSEYQISLSRPRVLRSRGHTMFQ
jgi:hypothetical protein